RTGDGLLLGRSEWTGQELDLNTWAGSLELVHQAPEGTLGQLGLPPLRELKRGNPACTASRLRRCWWTAGGTSATSHEHGQDDDERSSTPRCRDTIPHVTSPMHSCAVTGDIEPELACFCTIARALSRVKRLFLHVRAGLRHTRMSWSSRWAYACGLPPRAHCPPDAGPTWRNTCASTPRQRLRSSPGSSRSRLTPCAAIWTTWPGMGC